METAPTTQSFHHGALRDKLVPMDSTMDITPPTTTKFEMWITHYANDPMRVRVFTAARAIFNQYTPAVRKHGNRWFVEMVDANGVTFNDTYGHIFSGTVALYGDFYKTKREASTHTLTNEETRDFQHLCVDVAWELD